MGEGGNDLTTLPAESNGDTVSDTTTPLVLERGATIGRFVILDRLGGGATATVYSAFDPTLDRQVAIKLLHPFAWRDGDSDLAAVQRARVDREARAMARINHRNVVTVYEVGAANAQTVFIAMEKVVGGTLTAWLRTNPDMPQILRVFCEAGEGLAAAHRCGLIHRDFKPDNVLIASDGHPRVTDFGLARDLASDGTPADPRLRADADTLSQESKAEPLTQEGVILGTPGYMAPEQILGDPLDARADVFAFSAALYRALYGERPFVGETIFEITEATLTGRIREPPRDTRVPAHLRRVILRGLASDPSLRPESMDVLLGMLRHDPARRWRMGLASVVAVTVPLLLAFGGRVASEKKLHACDGADEPIRTVWNEGRQRAMADVFRRVAPTIGEAMWRQVNHAVDPYAAEWASAAKSSCVATRIRGEQSQTMFDLRAACLEERLSEVRALTDLLATADESLVKTSAKAAYALTRLNTCSNIDRLSANVALPGDADARTEIRTLEGELSKARALCNTGRRVKSLELLEVLRARVESARFGPLTTQWYAVKARAERRFDGKAAALDYERAIVLADEFRDDELRAQSEIALGSMEGSWSGRPAVAHLWFDLARAAIARLGGHPVYEVDLDEQEAWVYDSEHQYREAEPLFRRALSRAAEATVLDPDVVASAYSGLADVEAQLKSWEEAVRLARAAVSTIEEGFGANNLPVANYLNNLAATQLSAGDPDGALSSATRARDVFEDWVRRGEAPEASAEFGVVLHTLGEVESRRCRFSEAERSFDRARKIAIAVNGADNVDVALADVRLAASLRELQRSADAESMLADATRLVMALPDVPGEIRLGALAERAEQMILQGNPRAAVEACTRVLAEAGAASLPEWDVATVQLTLAKAYRALNAEREQVRSLSSLAKATFERLHDGCRGLIADRAGAGRR